MFLAFPYNKTIRWTHGKKGILSHFWNLQSPDPTKQYVKKRWKLTRRVIFLNLAPLDPTKQTVEQVQKIDMWGYFWKIISSRRVHKAVPIIYEQSWHVESLFWSLNVLPPSPPIPLKRYPQHINQFGILSHCYVFSPLSPTKTLRSTYKTTWHHHHV